jgi:hypothetical protein
MQILLNLNLHRAKLELKVQVFWNVTPSCLGKYLLMFQRSLLLLLAGSVIKEADQHYHHHHHHHYHHHLNHYLYFPVHWQPSAEHWMMLYLSLKCVLGHACCFW